MERKENSGYMKGFIPFIIAAAVLSLCGGFTAAVPANVVTDWGLDSGATTWITLAYSLVAAAMAPIMAKMKARKRLWQDSTLPEQCLYWYFSPWCCPSPHSDRTPAGPLCLL